MINTYKFGNLFMTLLDFWSFMSHTGTQYSSKVCCEVVWALSAAFSVARAFTIALYSVSFVVRRYKFRYAFGAGYSIQHSIINGTGTGTGAGTQVPVPARYQGHLNRYLHYSKWVIKTTEFTHILLTFRYSFIGNMCSGKRTICCQQDLFISTF